MADPTTGQFQPGDDPRRTTTSPGRPKNAEREWMARLIRDGKFKDLSKPNLPDRTVKQAILEVATQPEKYGAIWNRTIEWMFARAGGPIPTVTATIGGDDPDNPVYPGLGPQSGGIALMSTVTPPPPPAKE